ncbi:MAG TPA: hypothetical protein VN771_06075 [Candidatus Baltobacteraceae bacterium]|nr:hypothetical protein [Candidatus Baltobacteraceae bacterium]
MDMGVVSSAGRRSWVIVLATALVAVGCGSTATPTPTIVASASATPAATPSPSPSPSPTPDVSAAALAALSRLPTTGTQADVSGSLTSAAGTWPVHGTIAISGQDQQTDVTVTEGTVAVESHAVVSGGKSYVARGTGPYFAGPALAAGFGPTSGATLGSVLSSIGSLQDLGVETHAGQSLRHLKPTLAVTAVPFAFGLADATIKSPSLTVDVYADDTGKPILFAIGGVWQQTVGRTTMAVTAALDVTLRAGFASVTMPDEVWAAFSSKRFLYHAAKGTDWTLSVKAKDYDELETTEDAFIDITSGPTQLSLTAVTNESISVDTKDLGKKPEHNDANHIGGAPARLLTFHGTYKKTKLYVLDASVVYKGRAYLVTYSTLPGTESTDKATFLEFLGTFAFGR